MMSPKLREIDRPFINEDNAQSWVRDLDGDEEPEIIVTLPPEIFLISIENKSNP